MSFPPAYKGPSLSGELARKYERLLDEQQKANPAPSKELATVPDYLEAARRVYNFTPERLTEKEFKLRYAEEARGLGLSKDQVVRVYALETGGIGTYDMQAGIHPIKKTGHAISSALGYAQLLDANSVNELARSGAVFIARLEQKLRNPNNTPERIASLKRKIVVLRKMYANCKRVPFEWDQHQAYAKTLEGMGVHTINIDGDIAPILQAMNEDAEGHRRAAGPLVPFGRRDRAYEFGGAGDRPRDDAATGLHGPDTEFLRAARLLRKQDGDRADRRGAPGRARPPNDRGHSDSRYRGVRGSLRYRREPSRSEAVKSKLQPQFD